MGQRIISPDILEYIQQGYKECAALGLKDIESAILKTFNIDVSIETIRKAGISQTLTQKRMNFVFERVNWESTKQSRYEYASWYLSNPRPRGRLRVFIDESSLNLHMRRNCGRSPSGTRANCVLEGLRGTNLTLIGAMNRDKVLYSEILDGSSRNVDFKRFLEGLVPVLRVESILEDCTLIYDNAAIYHADIIDEYICSSGYNQMFLSPYSYMCNPIEFGFGKIKTHIRNMLSIDGDANLADTTLAALRSITSEGLVGY